MKWMKKLLGFNSPYSWMKWLKLSFAAAGLVIAFAFWSNWGFLVMDGGIIGTILALVLFAVIFGPVLLTMLGIAALLGMVIGGARSAARQRESLRETAATGSAELMELENLRRKSQRLDFLFILAVIVLVILWFALAEPLMEAFDAAGLYGYTIAAGVALIAFWIAKLPAKVRYKNAFKESVVRGALGELLDQMDFRPAEKLDEAVVRAAELFGHFDWYGGNDYLEADYKGRHFIQSDIHLQEEKEETYRDKNGNRQTRTVYVTVFRGRLMVFDYDAISNEPVAVYDRAGGKPKSNEAIQTELDDFNQMFSVAAPSPAAALRILTPPVLEGIVLARNKLGHPMYLAFREDKLYVGLANGDAFEAAGGDTTLSEQRRRVTDEITSMLALIDTLYLKEEGRTTL